MDEQVLAAMARWPNVPDVYGWLSLSRRGAWHLHPGGRGVDPTDSGDPITSPKITAFIGRNYAADAVGRWSFQNGPQRVYVRLDAAPWILRTEPDPTGALNLATHTGQHFGPVTHWWLDEGGHLYAQSEQGGGLIDGRDLPQVLEQLYAPDGPLLNTLEREPIAKTQTIQVRFGNQPPAPLTQVSDESIAAFLRFVPNPQPNAKIPA